MLLVSLQNCLTNHNQGPELCVYAVIHSSYCILCLLRSVAACHYSLKVPVCYTDQTIVKSSFFCCPRKNESHMVWSDARSFITSRNLKDCLFVVFCERCVIDIIRTRFPSRHFNPCRLHNYGLL